MFNRKGSQKGKDPSVPFQRPTTSKDARSIEDGSEPRVSLGRRFCRYLYNREKKLFCGRSCKSWLCIIGYSIMYLLFLSTYTLLFLFGSLSIIKFMDNYELIEKIELMTYSQNGIGLSATPTSVNNFPIISYRSNSKEDEKYVNELDNFFKRRKRSAEDLTLGPCGSLPFGYWKSPCIVIRINKQLGWSAKPLKLNTTDLNIPLDVREWMKLDQQKLWLHCHGVHSYDKEHIGKIIYYPDPPGFDPGLFPLDMKDNSPLVAVQITDFTLGISLAIECTLWYDGGSSSTAFLLYVTPKNKIIVNADKIVQ
ncbi:sodium/potassium-transporting ATPase subunit beta-1-like [Colias croceus]|uniref:sodium/potassium-transporting ATPase subunit beta-1-like n=1 Tax=Colias crocea TaxID=72248 RepID=UPI001E27A013|nr:sodium/potassium-transporting ATPase subunit beta-1-like [Colias croceus]